jgi:hypothetical protein
MKKSFILALGIATLGAPAMAASGSYVTTIQTDGPNNPNGIAFQMADDMAAGVWYCTSSRSPGASATWSALALSQLGQYPVTFLTGTTGVAVLHDEDCTANVTHAYRIRLTN